MNFLVYLHSIWCTHKNLFDFEEAWEDFEHFFQNLTLTKLEKYISRKDLREKIWENYQKINTKKIDARLLDLDVQIISHTSEKYPKYLENISHQPYFLYVRGDLDGEEPFLWVVGSRKMSLYGKKAWEKIIPPLTKYFTIVSGGAGWCDTLAHKIALENGGKTVVVFGTWIDITYPSSNASLFQSVVQNGGALVSQFPLGTLWNTYTFPMRNEIVAGMSRWVLLLEAGEKSGTLITAGLALEHSRDVFVVPWDIFTPNYIWSNNLLKTGQAKLVCEANDILDEYGYNTSTTVSEEVFSNEIQKKIFELLKYNLALSIDEILEKTDFEYGEISLNLSLMEIEWSVKKNFLGKYEL